MVPVMSLQPLLENVFKHTVEQRRQPTRIAVSASNAGGVLLVRVDDDGGTLAPAPRAGGIGLANLRERLALCTARPPAWRCPSFPLPACAPRCGCHARADRRRRAPARDKLQRCWRRRAASPPSNEAATASTRWRRIAAFAPDVLFLDIQMPEVSGIELAASLPAPAPPWCS
jgi:CheY-like chemotaxis protein